MSKRIDVLKLNTAVGAVPNYVLFRGQKESYLDLGLSEADSGVETTLEEGDFDASSLVAKIGDLQRSGKATRIVASYTGTNGKPVVRKIIVASRRVDTALAEIRATPAPSGGGKWSARVPTRRRLV